MKFDLIGLCKIISFISLTVFLCGSAALAQDSKTAEEEFGGSRNFGLTPMPKKRVKTSNSGKTGDRPGTAISRKKISVARRPTGGMKIWLERQAPDQFDQGAFISVSPRDVFKSGQIIRAHIQTNFSGFLTVVLLGSSGRISIIYPSANQINKLVPDTAQVIVPVDEKGIKYPGFQFDETAGIETLFFVVSRQPFNYTPSIMQEIANGRFNPNRDFAAPQPENNSLYVFADKTTFNKQLILKLNLNHQ